MTDQETDRPSASGLAGAALVLFGNVLMLLTAPRVVLALWVVILYVSGGLAFWAWVMSAGELGARDAADFSHHPRHWPPQLWAMYLVAWPLTLMWRVGVELGERR